MLGRWAYVGLSSCALLVLWNRPGTQPALALFVLALYVAVTLGAQGWLVRHPRDRVVKRALDVIDGLSVGTAAALSGGLDSPVRLLLYPHVVAVSTRGGIVRAVAVGVLDAAILLLLARWTPRPASGALDATALLACAAMAGATSSHLQKVRARLAAANARLSGENLQLSDSVAAAEAGLQQQDRAIALLRDSEERYRRLIERIQDGVLIIQDRRVAYANDVFTRMVGIPKQELHGKDLRDLVPPVDRDDLEKRYRSWQRSQAVSGELETRVNTAGGTALLVSVRAGSLKYEGRRSVVATVRDITRERRLEDETRSHLAELTRANQRLEELDRLRLEYLRNVSHEFRSPLTVLRGYVEYVRDLGSTSPEALAEPARVMLESCDRLIDLVDTLLEVGRVEQDGAEDTLQIQALDLVEAATHAVDPLRPLASKRGVRLVLDFPPAPLGLEADAGLLQLLVRKLVDNALNHSPAGAPVMVRGRAIGSAALILEVEDRGKGIPERHLTRIFDKFYTVDGGLDRRLGGTGVGLYLVREIARLHHGEVCVESRLGHGSRFSVRLPTARSRTLVEANVS
jgi:PAS domain S-box-containing protein